MSESQEKIVAFDNRFHEFGIQKVEGTDCAISPFFILNESENRIQLSLTSSQFTEMLSALVIGSEWAYPDKSHQIMFNFLRGLHCAPELQEDGDCVQYPSYASFISYEPQNPFTEETLVPNGYLKAPFSRWGSFETILPEWADEWIGGLVEWATGYQTNDIICDIGSLPIFANWLDLLTQGLPRLEIQVNGEGIVELELLAIPLGGQAIISIDNPIDLGDIFASIIDPNLRIIELNRDILSVPPETDVTHIEEIPVSGLGAHVIYVQFVPVIDDASIPVRFGGGIRSIELCGFDEIAQSEGIMDIRISSNCGIETLQNGVWTEKISKVELVNCLKDSFVQDVRNFGGSALVLSQQKNDIYTQVVNWNLVTNRISTAFNNANLALTENDAQDILIAQLQNSQSLQDVQIVGLQNSDVAQVGQISQLTTDVSDLFDADFNRGNQIANLLNADVAINNQLSTIVSVNNTQNSQIFALQDSVSSLLGLGQNFWSYDRNFADFNGNDNWNLISGGWDTLGFFEAQESNYTEIAIAHNAASIDANWFAVVRLNIALDVSYNVELLELSAFGLPHEAYFKRLGGNACVGYVKVPNLENAMMSFNIRFQQENVPFRLQSIKMIGIGLNSFPAFGGDLSFNPSF